jgi:hypothetical protein
MNHNYKTFLSYQLRGKKTSCQSNNSVPRITQQYFLSVNKTESKNLCAFRSCSKKTACQSNNSVPRITQQYFLTVNKTES